MLDVVGRVYLITDVEGYSLLLVGLMGGDAGYVVGLVIEYIEVYLICALLVMNMQ